MDNKQNGGKVYEIIKARGDVPVALHTISSTKVVFNPPSPPTCSQLARLAPHFYPATATLLNRPSQPPGNMDTKSFRDVIACLPMI
jgi:hypothetical protein